MNETHAQFERRKLMKQAADKERAAGGSDQRRVRGWSKEDAERLEYLYFHGCDKGDMPLRHIAAELGRTEAACRSKLSRMFSANAESDSR